LGYIPSVPELLVPNYSRITLSQRTREGQGTRFCGSFFLHSVFLGWASQEYNSFMPHPSDEIKSIERAMPREQTRGQHPNCNYEKCNRPADFTLESGTPSGSGYYDLCREHLTKELEKPEFAARILIALISELLPKVLPQQESKPQPSVYEKRGVISLG
jgi:hypothetical protein